MTATSVPLVTHLFLLAVPAVIVLASIAAFLLGGRRDR